MAKVKGKSSGLKRFNKVLFVIFLILLVATILIVALSAPKIAVDNSGPAEFVDEVKIDEFKSGTYGGKDFSSVDDVVNYYVECYDHTKTVLAPVTYEGEPKDFYKLLGEESLEVTNLLVEGKSNATINNLVPGVVGGLFSGWPKALPPSVSNEPEWDKTESGISFTTSALTPDDVLMANVVDNGDGTINITIQPKAVYLAMPGEDSQGKFFNVLGDISSTVESISILSFSQGTVNDNFVVNYAGGSGTVTIDTKTNEIVSADYTMNVHIDIQHANVAVLKDKSASLDVIYKNTFPASDEYLNSKGTVRK